MRLAMFFGIVVAAALGLAAHARQDETPLPAEVRGSEVPVLDFGSPLPDLGVETWVQPPPDGKTFQEAIQGKAVVIEFWATWCPPCIAAIPHLNALAEEMRNEPIVFVSVAIDDVKKVEAFVKKTPMRSWVGVDTTHVLAKLASRVGVPATILVDRAGKIQSFTRPELLNPSVLRDLIAGKQISLLSAYSVKAPLAVVDDVAADREFAEIRRVLSIEGRALLATTEGRWTFVGYPAFELILDAWWDSPDKEVRANRKWVPKNTLEFASEPEEELGPCRWPTKSVDLEVSPFSRDDGMLQYRIPRREWWFNNWWQSSRRIVHYHRARIQDDAGVGRASVTAVVNVPNANEEELRNRLKTAIREHFDVDPVMTEETRPAIVLKRPLVLKPGDRHLRWIRPSSEVGKPFRVNHFYDTLFCTNVRMREIAELLECCVFYQSERVIDETNDLTEYDVRLEIPLEANFAEVAKCVAQQLGLVLEWAERPQPLLIIRKRGHDAAAPEVPAIPASQERRQ